MGEFVFATKGNKIAMNASGRCSVRIVHRGRRKKKNLQKNRKRRIRLKRPKNHAVFLATNYQTLHHSATRAVRARKRLIEWQPNLSYLLHTATCVKISHGNLNFNNYHKGQGF